MANAYVVVECSSCGGKFARDVNETWKKTCRSCHRVGVLAKVMAQVSQEYPEDVPAETVMNEAKARLAKRQELVAARRKAQTLAGAFEKAGIKVKS